MTAKAEGVDADRETGFGRGLIDRPVAALPKRLGVAAHHQHLREVLVAGARANLLCRGWAIFGRHHDRRLKAAVLAGPLRDLPIIDCMGQRCAEIEASGGAASFLAADLSSLEEVHRLASAVQATVGRLDILITMQASAPRVRGFRLLGLAATVNEPMPDHSTD